MNCFVKKQKSRLLVINFCFCLIFVLFFRVEAISQADDLVTWSSLQFSKALNENTTFHAKPIYRRFKDQKEYQNSSFDIFINYKFNTEWSFQALHRYWFIPDNGDRYFIFLEASHQFSNFGKFKIKNTFRYHLAFDKNYPDGDFFRWHPLLSYTLAKNLSIFIANQWFFQFNDFNELTRVRYILGFSKKFTSRIGLNFQYWRQSNLNKEVNAAQNVLVSTLAYKL